MSSPTIPTPAFRLHPVDPGPAIPAPPDGPGGGGMLTGLETLARITPREGLTRLWHLSSSGGRGSPLGPDPSRSGDRIQIEIVDATGPNESPRPGERMDGSSLRMGDGRWERRIPLADGSEVVERGLLPDDVPGALLEWSVAGHSPPETPPEEVVIHLEPGARTLRLSQGAPPVRMAILPVPGEAPTGLARGKTQGSRSKLLARAPNRARVRGQRSGLLPEEEILLVLNQDHRSRDSLLSLPIQILDQAPLGSWEGRSDSSRDGSALHILAGVEEGRPRFLSGAGVAEYGLAALLAGRRATALGILQAPGSIPTTAPLPWLLLCSRWCLWTGIPDPLLREGDALQGLKAALKAAVEAAMEAGAAEMAAGGMADAGAERPAGLDAAVNRAEESLGTGAPGGGAAFPSLPRLLEELASGMGNAPGRGNSPGIEAVTAAQRALQAGRPDSRLPDPSGAMPSRIPLPVLGSPATPSPADRPDHPSLPPPEAFAPLDAPAVAPHRTLHAARLVRSWIEGRFGAEADAGVGRLTLSPEIQSPQTGFALRRLAVGDARVSLTCAADCRGGRAILTFRFHQESGRVPVNLIFQPRLFLVEVEKIRMGKEEVAADVETRKEGGLLLRCQFPLDAERRLVIEGPV